MNPQHSSPARAVSRCRDALQVNICTEYKSVHLNGHITSSYTRHIIPNGRRKSYCQAHCEIGDRRMFTESFLRPPNEPWVNVIGRSLTGFSSVCPGRTIPIDKHIKFNRMNGSPGDPPAIRMHISKHIGITPVNHRLASDPIGKEADWETST